MVLQVAVTAMYRNCGCGCSVHSQHDVLQVAVNALLGDTPTLVEYGSALMANLATKEVKAVVCIFLLYINIYIYITEYHHTTT